MKNHLKVCELYLQLQAQKNAACSAPCEEDRVSSISTDSKKSQGSSTSSNLKKLKSSSVLGFMDRAMSPSEISLLHQRIIEMIADNVMSLNWIEHPSTRRFFEVLRPSAVRCMPTRRQLSGKLFEHAARSSRDDIIPEMKLNENFNCSYFFVCDGWVDNSKRLILGSIVPMLMLLR